MRCYIGVLWRVLRIVLAVIGNGRFVLDKCGFVEEMEMYMFIDL